MQAGVVIVGAGFAAGEAAVRIRQGGYAGPISMVGAEPHLPYHRPPLSKTFLAGDARLDALFLRHEVETFNAAYAAALDEQRLSDWVKMFTDDALYVFISRENFDRGMPVGLIYCENKGKPRPWCRHCGSRPASRSDLLQTCT